MRIELRNPKVQDTRYRDGNSIELRLIDSCNFIELQFKSLEELRNFQRDIETAVLHSVEKSKKV